MPDSLRLDQPRANDLVGNPLLITGSRGGFEGDIAVRVLDGNGQTLVEPSVTNTNLTSAWQSTGARGPRVSVPVFYGTAITPGFRSYVLYIVQTGTRCPASPCRRRHDTSASASSRPFKPTGTSWS